MEEALKICCKNSLQSMHEALHGDGTTDPNPLIKLGVNLIGNKVVLFKDFWLLRFLS